MDDQVGNSYDVSEGRSSKRVKKKKSFKTHIHPMEVVPTEHMTKDIAAEISSDEEEEKEYMPEREYIEKKEREEMENSCCCSCWTKFHQRTRTVVISKLFNYIVLVLVVCDTLVVIGEVMLESYGYKHPADESIKKAQHVLHDVSLSILSIFLAEIPFRLFGLQLDFFKDKFEVFDACIVIMSFFLSIFLTAGTLKEGVELLVLLRLWRITRIINGIILTVKARARARRRRLIIRIDLLLEENRVLHKMVAYLGENLNMMTESQVDYSTSRDFVTDFEELKAEVEQSIEQSVGGCEACKLGLVDDGNPMVQPGHIQNRYHQMKQKSMQVHAAIGESMFAAPVQAPNLKRSQEVVDQVTVVMALDAPAVIS